MGLSRKMKRKEDKDNQKALLKKAFDRGYEKGRAQGVNNTVDYLALKMDELEKVEGIGEKTALKVAKHFGFEVVNDN